MNAFAAAESNGRAAELQAELEELFTAQNTSGSPDRTVIPATFLRVTVEVTRRFRASRFSAVSGDCGRGRR